MPPEEERRWIGDEMLGKLSRYLRFLGYDVVYAKGRSDSEIVALARAEGRWVVTRDRALAERSRHAVLLSAFDVVGQLRELRAAYPELRTEVAFRRCSLCNALLRESDRSAPNPPKGVPEDVWRRGIPVYGCEACHHAYWEGGHTVEIRETLGVAFAGPPPGRPPARGAPT